MSRVAAHRATLFFSCPPTLASAIAGALAPEAAHSEVPKTRGAPRLADGGLAVDLEAEDLASLRATVNSHLRWVDAAARAARLADG